MPVKKSRTAHITAVTPRGITARALATFLALSSVALMVMSQAGSQNASRIRTTLTDVIAPAIAVASKPFDAIASAGEWVSSMVNLRAENMALKNTNVQLLQWQSIAKTMEAENSSLRALLNVVQEAKNNYITARIVTDMSGPYVRSALISGGSEHGIKKDQAVISELGLVGRVVEAGNTSSRILLLSDINSRIPVMSETSREKTILVGNNNELPSLSYIESGSSISVGERIITSGDGGVFPRGIAVGVVTAIEKGVIRVQPFVDASKIEYVSVIEYSL
ncbi:MAG: rod shape-determining protein MreC [Rickettsiales bacterium]